ncbi:MAG: DMT family transporter [Clostridia bacterium]|nr:DMT family transporter [Clostridia bacterium]
MLGYLFSIIAGAAMSFQGVMNTRLGEKVGIFASNAYVQGTAFALSLLALLFAKDTNFNGFAQTNKIYLFGGVLGLVITVTVMLSIKNLSPVVAISVILVSQLICAALIDAFGILNSEKVAFSWNKYIGAALMICGVILLKWTPHGA